MDNKETKIENLETRFIPIEESEIRMEKNSRTITGDAIVFNRESQLLYEGGQLFYEMIKPEAVRGVLDRSDIKVWLNHDHNKGLLARSKNGKGSLTVASDDNSVRFSFEAPKFALGDELIENIKRGDIKGTSFAFRVADGGESWSKRSDGTKVRTITEFSQIGDISPCYDPAYVDTTVAVRNLEKLEIEEEQKSEVKAEDTKPVIEEPITEPIVDKVETKIDAPAIDPEKWYKEQKQKNPWKY